MTNGEWKKIRKKCDQCKHQMRLDDCIKRLSHDALSCPYERYKPKDPSGLCGWNLIRDVIGRKKKWKCLSCGKKDKSNHIHHLVPKRVITDNTKTNLIVLCCSCHLRLHQNMKKGVMDLKIKNIISLKLTPELVKKIADLAKVEKRSISNMTRYLLDIGIENYHIFKK